MRACGAGHPRGLMYLASRSHPADCFGFDLVLRKLRLVSRAAPAEGQCSSGSHVNLTLRAERGLVERDLLLAAELVGQLFPRGCDVVGAGLRVGLTGEDLGQFVFRDAVILEDAGNARLDRTIRMIVGAELRVEIG